MEILICVTLPDATKSSKYSTKYHPVNTFNYKHSKPYLNKSTYPQLNVVEGALRSFGTDVQTQNVNIYRVYEVILQTQRF